VQIARRGFASNVPSTKLFINNEFVESKTSKWIDLRNPATQEVVTRVPEATQEEMNAAVAAASSAFKEWRKTTPLTRQRLMLDLQRLIRDNMVSILSFSLLQLLLFSFI
jgi:malonate-semialdehyde dehydrogenase (acetylating)/methylmalonate-semialdehyde dehydrogenase